MKIDHDETASISDFFSVAYENRIIENEPTDEGLCKYFSDYKTTLDEQSSHLFFQEKGKLLKNNLDYKFTLMFESL